ncbi:subtilisin-like protein [Cylindrobasidium torrendii FP15055 ss-10]|uniref:tripeptidyl-peptidase II n=1 Tax=Cylindrobasidium torrendii FP15055 ss-10 TaxID=1314674 RepID=A0A0D7BNX7_9AGAR|nr:subtilisin-like protein [Cylindrobasidium torrendii FP15055 ss-10]
MRWSPALFLVAAHFALATPLVSKRWEDASFLEKHSWNAVPRGWVYQSAPSPDHLLDMRIGLKKARGSELIAALYEVSTPSNERYGQHLSKEDVDALVAPHADTVEAVESWLRFHGIEPAEALFRSSGGNWLTLSVSVAQAERMLDTTYGVYTHPETSETVVRTLSYSLPEELHQHIDVMTPTTYFSTLQTLRSNSFIIEENVGDNDVALKTAAVGAAVPSSCNTAITIACLKALYNTAGYVPTATDVNVLGVAGYLDQYANRADLQTFLKAYASNATGTSYETVLVNEGGDDQSDPGVEANLDIQYTVGLSAPTPNIYYSTGGSPPFIPDSDTPTNTNEPYLDWLNFILAEDTIPQTITTSYGENEQTIPRDYAESVCDLFAELGARGATVFFSSGDYGVGGSDCLTNDGTNTTLFQPAFPASCPYVTAVGGTHLVNPEQAVSFSGGGFSRYFDQPDYQTAAVDDYVSALGTQYNGLYNPAGRAYPDLAAQGSGFRVVIGGSVYSVGGTSASSPTVAGIFSLLNDYRLSNGLPSLGFVNPLIYANPAGFNDITAGNNPGCDTNGFDATAGWDPVTGLGTPDFLKLQPIVLA